MFVQQVGGKHYGGGKFQHWDFVLQTGQDYLSSVATKYLCRWRDKGGIQDVQKGISYVDKMLGALSVGEMAWPLPIDQAKARVLWPLYLETYQMDDLEREATYELIFAERIESLIHARQTMLQIIAKEVFSWPELSFVTSKIKPDGWQGFTFEGAKKDFCWHRCTVCREQFQAPVDQPPMLFHECGIKKTNWNPAMVSIIDGSGKPDVVDVHDNGKIERFSPGWHGLTAENGYKDDDGKPTPGYVDQG